VTRYPEPVNIFFLLFFKKVFALLPQGFRALSRYQVRPKPALLVSANFLASLTDGMCLNVSLAKARPRQIVRLIDRVRRLRTIRNRSPLSSVESY